jgi:hypothetical protein
MRIVYHLGAHCTDEERLVRCLLKNRGALAGERIAVPSPIRYRRLIRDMAMGLNGGRATPEQQALILDQILEDSDVDRMILSWDSFLGYAPWAIRGALYPFAGERSRAITQVFPDHEAEFHLALRNPATFLPAMRKAASPKVRRTIDETTSPLDLRWSDVVLQIQAYSPGVPLTVWCDEETPLIWTEVLQAVSGHDPARVLDDTDELLSQIMTDLGLARLKAYMTEHPPQTVERRRRVISAFLEKFSLPDRIDYEIEMPDWTEDLVARMTDLYNADVERIRQIPGVTLLTA